jgi:Cu(I)/Ag(I) efflux system protein CusF
MHTMKIISTLFATLALVALAPLAANAAGHVARVEAAAGTQAVDAAALSEGEVKKVDKDTGRITIKHGPLTNLNMPGMSMVFRVRDPAMLEQVKAGDQIRFRAEKVDGALVVTTMKQVQ